VIFAGGGTGGHIMPGAATAEALHALLPGARCLFLATDRGSERQCRRALAGFEVLEMPAARWEGLAQKARFAATAPLALVRCVEVLRGFRPHVVVGLGGYSSVLPVLAARALGLRTMLFESNAIPGRVVRALAPLVDCVQVQWSATGRCLRARRVTVTGNPIRDGVLRSDRAAARARLGLAPARCTLLVMGGSQGALALNRLALGALRRMGERPDMLPQGGMQVLHLTGPAHLEEVLRSDAPCGMVYRPVGFLHEMEDAYAAADFVVARAGGSSLAELTAAGLPAVLVPFPFAADDHQTANAAVLAEAGAAVAIAQSRLTADTLAALISDIARNAERRAKMAECSRSMGRPDAARAVAAEIAALANFKLDVAVTQNRASFTKPSLSKAA